MAEISTAITYTVKFVEREYKLMTKGLALLAGVVGPKAMPEDREAAAQLNQRLLDQQAADLREKLGCRTQTKREVGHDINNETNHDDDSRMRAGGRGPARHDRLFQRSALPVVTRDCPGR